MSTPISKNNESELQNFSEEYIYIDENTITVQKQKEVELTPPPSKKESAISKTTRQFIQEYLGDRATECLDWGSTKVYSSFDNTNCSEESNRLSAKNVINQWEIEVKNRMYWSERVPEGILSLEAQDNDPITVGELYAHLTKIMALHRDVATMPIRHAECHSDVETFEVTFRPEDGYLLFE